MGFTQESRLLEESRFASSNRNKKRSNCERVGEVVHSLHFKPGGVSKKVITNDILTCILSCAITLGQVHLLGKESR